MKVRESGMPEARYWETLFDIPLVMERMKIAGQNLVRLTEFGCGYGTFTVEAAQVGAEVVAFDIEPAMTHRTALRARLRGLSNVSAQTRDLCESGSGLLAGSCDYVMLFNLLHGEAPQTLLIEARRILRSGGTAGIVHWNFDPTTPRGPGMDIRPRPQTLLRSVRELGFTADGLVDLPPYHYGIIAKREANE